MKVGGGNWAGDIGKLPEGVATTVKPTPPNPSDPNCCPVSKNTPPPPRTTVSHPAALRRMYAAPSRGAMLYQVVFQSDVPCGARARVARLLPTAVYGMPPFVAPGGGLISQRKPTERVNLGAILHSSWANAEKLV